MTRFKAFKWIFCLWGLSLHAQEVFPFPEGCGNPFVPDGAFGDFYEKTIQSSVIEAGAVSATHVDLFSVNRIRKYMAAKYPNPADGELVDRHLRAQLCEYSKSKTGLSSTDVLLHRHLASISGRLMRDVKSLVSELNAKERERQKSVEKFEARYSLIEKAEEMAEKEVATYLR